MVTSTRILVCYAAALALVPLAGCGGSDDDDDRDGTAVKAVDGTFVGKLAGTNAFVAVVASPSAGKQQARDVAVYVSDGRRISEWFPGSAKKNRFSATSDDKDAKAKGKLTAKAVSGTVELPDGKRARYRATRATGAAGLYELTVTSDGELSGASAAGVGLRGETTLERGTIKLADGTRERVSVTGDTTVEGSLRAALRLIVLRRGELRGAGERRSAEGDPGIFIRSAS